MKLQNCHNCNLLFRRREFQNPQVIYLYVQRLNVQSVAQRIRLLFQLIFYRSLLEQ